MTNLQMWSLIVGFVMPPVQAILQQQHWPNRIRALLNFVLCAVVALGITYFKGGIDFHNWISSALVVLVTAIASYHGLWKPTDVAPAIEAKTSTAPPAAAAA
jgi:hypothetical protein